MRVAGRLLAEGTEGLGDYDAGRFWASIAAIRTSAILKRAAQSLGVSGNKLGVDALLSGSVRMAQNNTASLVGIDWANLGHFDRSDRWAMHQLMFTRDAANEWLKGSPPAAQIVVERIFREWWAANATPAAVANKADMAWHDHTTAFRLLHLMVVLKMLVDRGDDPRAAFPDLPRMLAVHLAVLKEDSFYSKGTNHGFDQAFCQLTAAASVELGELSAQSRHIAAERLIHEASIAFNDEGVHIENSPSYHFLMIPRLLRAETLLRDLDCMPADGPDVSSVLRKAVHFATFALRPDGCPVLLGDSDSIKIGFNTKELQHVEGITRLEYAFSRGEQGNRPVELSAVFPRAGYAFARDGWGDKSEFLQALHLSFKCGYLSNYHRRDDDNTLLLWAFGEEWLVGSGIYKYHEDDPIRRYLRSSRAQSIVSPVGVPASRECAAARSRITAWSDDGRTARFEARSSMFAGMDYKRTVGIDREALSITVEDEIVAAEPADRIWQSRWHFAPDKDVTIESGCVSVRSRASTALLRLTVLEGTFEAPALLSGIAGDRPEAWTSSRKGELAATNTLCFTTPKQPAYHARMRLTLERTRS